MAPKKQKGSFLTRGRQRVQQTRQMKETSARKLPPKGGTSAGSPKATGQRVARTVQQRAQMDVARTRALGDMLQRNSDRNARSEGVKEGMKITSGKTRYVPPGGENARGQASLPTGKRGGAMTQKGGPITRRSPSQPQSTGGPVERVNVREVGSSNTSSSVRQSVNRLSGGAQRSLPAAGQSGGSNPPKGTTAPQRGGPSRTPQQLAMERRANAAAKSAGQSVRTSPTSRPASTGTPVGAATRAATRGGNFARGIKNFAGRASGPLVAGVTGVTEYNNARKRGETQGRSVAQGFASAAGAAAGARLGASLPLPPIGKGIGALIGGAIGASGAVKGMQGIQEAGKAEDRKKFPTLASTNKLERQGPIVPTRILAQGGGRSNTPIPPTAAKSKRPSSAPTPTNGNSSQRTSTSSSTSSKASASKGSNTPSQAAPAQPGKKWEDFNPNRNTSESNNPLLGDYLRSKMKQREGKADTTGVGPVKSGDGYESNLRIEKNKKKKDK